MNNAADEIVILSDALEALRLRTEELEQKLDTTAQPLAAASVALGGALDGIKALQFHVRDSNLGALSGRIEELRTSVAEKIAAFSTQLVDAGKRLESEQRQNVDGLRVELGAIGSAVAALSEKFGSELARIEMDAKAEIARIEQIKMQVGPEGRSLNPRGTFVDGETYNRLDVVSWLGSSYIAAVDGVTEKPSRNSNQWQVLASRGGGAGGVGDFASLAGVAQINQGGTGQTTRAAALNALLPSQTGATQYVLLTDGSGNVSWGAQPVAGLPSQTSNGGKLLTTDGTNASWSNAVTVSGNNATVTGTLTTNGTFTATSGMVSTYQTAPQFSITPSGGRPIRFDANVGNVSFQANGGGWFMGTRFLGSAGTLRGNIWGAGTDDVLDTINIGDGSYSQWLGASSTKVAIPLTTASTSTSTGALVVSGGVGVAGTIYAGGTIRVVGSSHTTRFRRDDAIIDFSNTAENAYVTGTISGNTLQLKGNNGTGLTIGTTGNATFAGTLTVNGTSTFNNTITVSSNVGFIGKSGSGTGGNWRYISDDGTSRWLSGILGTPSETAFDIYDIVNGRSLLTLTAAGVVKVPQTTASTSTSTGALVVSGGVGVAGAGYFGSTVDVSGSGAIGLKFTTSNSDAQVRLISTAAGGRSYSIGSGATAAYAGNGFYIYDETGGATALLIDSNRQVQVKATTASTTTSTGALVVSGGVGVAGSIWAGVRLNVEYPTAANGSEHNVIKGIMGTDATLGALELNMGVLPSATAGSRYGYIACQDSLANRGIYLGGRPGQGPGGATIYVPSTASSTSTSSGALVVSGGVGVAGAAYVGGNATVFGTAGITINNVNGLGNDSILTLTQSGVSNAFIKNTATTGDIAIGDGGGTYLTITKGVGVVSLLNTSASTSTSTGALVVSGGVGVAGAIYAGGMIQSGGALQASMGGTTNATTLNLIGGGSSDGNYLNFADVNIGGQGLGAAFLRWTRDNGLGRAFSIHVSNNAGSTTTAAWFDVSGNVIQKVNGTAPSLTSNSTMTFELTSNTSLKIFVRGSDGTTRSTTLTLA